MKLQRVIFIYLMVKPASSSLFSQLQLLRLNKYFRQQNHGVSILVLTRATKRGEINEEGLDPAYLCFTISFRV